MLQGQLLLWLFYLDLQRVDEPRWLPLLYLPVQIRYPVLVGCASRNLPLVHEVGELLGVVVGDLAVGGVEMLVEGVGEVLLDGGVLQGDQFGEHVVGVVAPEV